MCRACNKSKRCEEQSSSPERSRNDRNLIVESKGVSGNGESEGSRRQTLDATNRNLIQGLSAWVIEPEIKRPESHSEDRGVNQAHEVERFITYPGRS